MRIDRERVLLGVVGTDTAARSSRARRRLRLERDRHVSPAVLARTVTRVRELGPGVVEDFELHRQDVMSQLKEDPKLQAAVIEQLGRDLDVSVQQSHDFLQLAKLVGGYAEELLLALNPEQEPSLTAEQHEVEGSIYFATEMMVQKLDALAFLQDPHRALSRMKSFKIHPLFIKYLRMYQWKARQKGLSLNVTGACFETVFYDDQAIGAVLQGILDNMVKYAPAGSHAVVNFDVVGEKIVISCSSLGPKILPHELESIFSLGVRGEAARELEETGHGVGLATARQISDVLGLRLTVQQSPDENPRYAGHYSTMFQLSLAASRS